MPTCNFYKIVHNIQIQQLEKRGVFLYVTTFDEYVRAFRQSSLNKDYLKGGWSRKGPERNEFHLKRANQFGDPLQIVAIVTSYTMNSSFATSTPHLEGEKVFRF
jgi:hypothetical protein